jgi:hypothetical protein
MRFSVNDRVTHRDYPDTAGTVTAMMGVNLVVVLWDIEREPGNSNNSMDLSSRSSRHIPWALRHSGEVIVESRK